MSRASLSATIEAAARLLIAFVVVVWMPLPGLAQSGSAGERDPWSGVEEMIVSGSAGTALLVEASTSVVAFDDDELGKIGALNIGDLAEYTPNLEINSPYAASNPQLFIRGVGLQDSNSNASSAVAVVVDGVYKNSPAGQLSSLFDVQTIEVLRGPQGAQYGRNASAGVVRVLTNPPLYEFQSNASVTYGRFNQLDLDGVLNIPIVPDLLATRFAFRYVSRDPLGKNRCAFDRDNNFPTNTTLLIGTKCFAGMVTEPARGGNDPLPLPPSRTHDRESWFARWSFRLDPTEELDFVLRLNGGQNLGLAPQFQNRGTEEARSGRQVLPGLRRTSGNNYVDPDTCTDFSGRFGTCVAADLEPGAGDPFNGDYSRGGDERLTLGGITLNANWERGPWTLESVTNADYADREVVLDFDASPAVQADAFITDESWQVFENLELSWDGDIGIVLTTGAQFFYENLQADNNFWNTPRTNLAQQYEQVTTAAAAFGYIEYELSDTLTLEGGARVNWERKNFTISSAYNTFANNVFNQALGRPLTGYQNRREIAEQVRPSGEIVLNFEPTEDIKFYGRFTRGYKGQHFNGNALSTAQPIDPIDPEFVNAFEIGWRLSFFDGMLRWNGAGFYYDYENQQVFLLTDAPGVSVPVPILVNAEDSRLIGLESDITFAWEGFRWFNSVGLIFSEYSDFRRVQETVSVSAGGDISVSFEVENYSGNALVNAPEFSLVGFAEYAWPLPGELGTLTPRFDYRFKSQVFYTPDNDSRIAADDRWIFDARIDYATVSGEITIGVWVRNITEEYYAVTAYDRERGAGSIVYVVSAPRTYGTTVSIRF